MAPSAPSAAMGRPPARESQSGRTSLHRRPTFRGGDYPAASAAWRFAHAISILPVGVRGNSSITRIERGIL
jgi:hypothetical protein